jgi:hypothetical protein
MSIGGESPEREPPPQDEWSGKILAMKLLFSCILLISVAFSISLDFVKPSPEWRICEFGLCRGDQLPTKASYNPKTTNIREMTFALRRDPANALLWAQGGEILDNRGDEARADDYFRRAVELGPNITPVLMAAVNHDLIVNRMDDAFRCGSRILSLTPDFDTVLFDLYDTLGPPVPALLGPAIPAERRAASSWMRWLLNRGSEEELMASWAWVSKNHFADDDLAGRFVWQLYKRGSVREASEIWAQWLGANRGDYLSPDLLANRRFAMDPRISPFDWNLEPSPSVQTARNDGLEFVFSGAENVNFASMYQYPAVSPGAYRFSAVVESQDITTKQCPQFRIFNTQEPYGRVSAVTPSTCGTTPRHNVDAVFTVPPGVTTVTLRLERLPSDKIDNKISGTFKVHEVSLRRQ